MLLASSPGQPGPRCPQPLVAACLLVAVVSCGHFPSRGSGFGVSLLLAGATEGLDGSRSAGLGGALQFLLDLSFSHCKMGAMGPAY